MEDEAFLLEKHTQQAAMAQFVTHALNELKYYRLIDDREESRNGKAGCYTLACGHSLLVSPAYPDSIHYLPCAECSTAANLNISDDMLRRGYPAEPRD